MLREGSRHVHYGSRKRVLIADDVAELRSAFRTTVERGIPEADVVEAADEEAVLAIADEEAVDVFVLDYRLGEADGLALLLRLRKHHPEAAFAMVSAYGDLPLDALQLGALGVDAFIRKPWQINSLRWIVRYLMHTEPPMRSVLRAAGTQVIRSEVDDTMELRSPADRRYERTRQCPNFHDIPRSARFCPECGVPLKTAQEVREEALSDRLQALRRRLAHDPELVVALERAIRAPKPTLGRIEPPNLSAPQASGVLPIRRLKNEESSAPI